MHSSEAPSSREARNGQPQGPARHTQRFPKWRRLKDSKDFEDALQQATRWVGKFMVMCLRHAPDAAGRLGVIASKRTFRKAHERNRAKRLLREAFRKHACRISDRCDIVLMGRYRILDAGGLIVETEFRSLAGKAGIWSPPPAGPAKESAQ